MEKELRKYLSCVISDNLDIEVEASRVHLDPYILVFLLPTWISKVTYCLKEKFKRGEDIFSMDVLDLPELESLDENERKHVMEIYRMELYTIHNIIEYYCSNMIDSRVSFTELFSNMLMDTCTTPTIIMEEYIKINDHGIVYYIPYDILIHDLINDVNINPYTNEPYSSLLYQNMRHKYAIEIKLLTIK